MRAINRWVLWLLPLFVLRSLVPAGFMLDRSGDIVVCAATGPVAMQTTVSSAQAAHAHHDHHARNTASESLDHEHSSAHPYSLCVFAVGGTSHAPPLHVAVLADAPVSGATVSIADDPELASLSILFDRIRGPPNA